jgi:uncharacterized membrane protein (UPF0127 family)
MRWSVFLCFFLHLFGAEIQLGNEILDVEIVDTPEALAIGLMGRKGLPEGKGMLFIYPTARMRGFWMKNTLIPLSVAFFDEEKSLINIADMDVPKGGPLLSYPSSGPARYALEVPQGWFKKHKIGPGVKFSFLDQSNQIK